MSLKCSLLQESAAFVCLLFLYQSIFRIKCFGFLLKQIFLLIILSLLIASLQTFHPLSSAINLILTCFFMGISALICRTSPIPYCYQMRKGNRRQRHEIHLNNFVVTSIFKVSLQLRLPKYEIWWVVELSPLLPHYPYHSFCLLGSKNDAVKANYVLCDQKNNIFFRGEGGRNPPIRVTL